MTNGPKSDGKVDVKSMRKVWFVVVATVGAVVASAVPAGAQQLVDAGKEGDGSGGLAFVLMALMVMLIAASLFFMDRIRRRRQGPEESATS
jgi:hypothetical protein